MNSQSKNLGEKKLYAKEFHIIRDNDTTLAYDIENSRLLELNDLELSILKNIKAKPTSITELRQRLSHKRGEAAEEAANELINVDMLGYSSYPQMSAKKINDLETEILENFQKKNFMQIALNVTHKCNFNCDYCYGEDGSYGGPAIHMNRDTAKQAVHFLLNESGDSDLIRITLFGGEPLLNFDLIKFVVQYSQKEASKLNKKVLLGMTTNAALLDDEKTDFLIKENIELTFSFDGPKEIQDNNRRLKSKREKSSYDIVYPKILKYIEKAEKYNGFYAFRSTVTRSGLININEMVDFFKSFKTDNTIYDFAEYKNYISQGGLAINDDDLDLFRQKLKEMAIEYKEKNLEPEYDFFSGALKEIKAKKRTINYCISPGVQYVGVSAEGDIFPCHRFVGYKETKLGNVWDGFDREAWLKKFAAVNIYNSKVCSKCWLRYYCGGICPATSYFLCNDMVLSEKIDQEPVHCKIKKIVYEEAMIVGASIFNDSSEADVMKRNK
jgi:uncharacterized protein